MQITYIPNDLGYYENGRKMEREKFDAMVGEIFEKGKVVNVHVHGYTLTHPGEEPEYYGQFSKAVTVLVDEPIKIEYIVHINRLNPITVIERFR